MIVAYRKTTLSTLFHDIKKVLTKRKALEAFKRAQLSSYNMFLYTKGCINILS